jgi:hypothetical protein
MNFHDALNNVIADLTPQPWDYSTVDGTTLTVIPAGLREDPGAAEVYVRITVDKAHAAQAAITTTDLPNLIAALEQPLTGRWELVQYWPDGTRKLTPDSTIALTPAAAGVEIEVREDAAFGALDASIELPESQRLPLASALRRALDVARGWEG